MEKLVLARHGESVLSARGEMNGDASVPCPLTDEGRRQARNLGRMLAAEPIGLVAVTGLARTWETADAALGGRHAPLLVVPELTDIHAGAWEGKPLAEYREWAWTHGPLDDPPGGGESRAAAARRIAAGLRKLLERDEGTILLVAHALPIRYVLDAAEGRAPAQRLEPVPYAEPFRLTASEVRCASWLLDGWAAAPAFRG